MSRIVTWVSPLKSTVHPSYAYIRQQYRIQTAQKGILLWPMTLFLTLMVIMALLPDPPELLSRFWLALMMTGLFSWYPLFQSEMEDGHVVYVLCSNWSSTQAIRLKILVTAGLFILPYLFILLILSVLQAWTLFMCFQLMLLLVLMSIGMLFLGAFGVVLTFGLRQSALLMPLVLLPLYVPMQLLVGHTASLVIQSVPGTVGLIAWLGSLVWLGIWWLPRVIVEAIRIGQ